jgi:hypothetical protein
MREAPPCVEKIQSFPESKIMSLSKNLSEAEKSAIGETDTQAFRLVPCRTPGCGSRRLYVGRHCQESYSVQCLDCGCRSVEARTLEEAVENWGTEPLAQGDRQSSAEHLVLRR